MYISFVASPLMKYNYFPLHLMKKSHIQQNNLTILFIFTLRWSVDIKFYIFTSEKIKYTLYFINIFLYFPSYYVIIIVMLNEQMRIVLKNTVLTFLRVPVQIG